MRRTTSLLLTHSSAGATTTDVLASVTSQEAKTCDSEDDNEVARLVGEATFPAYVYSAGWRTTPMDRVVTEKKLSPRRSRAPSFDQLVGTALSIDQSAPNIRPVNDPATMIDEMVAVSAEASKLERLSNLQRKRGMPSNPKAIDEYLAALNDDKRAALKNLREIIRTAAPGAEECISYQLPAFRLHGKLLVGFGATANHCAFYPMSGSTIEAFQDDLKDYDTSKGTIRFQADDPLPADILQKLVRARIAENGG